MNKGYRKCVGIIVARKDNKVLLCERNDLPGQWQFPQGGIETGESIAAAGRRELEEETSLVSVVEIAELDTPLRYDFPPQIQQNNKWEYAGQDMFWVLFRFTGTAGELNLQTADPEFRNFRWTDIDDAPKNIVEFKRNVYIKAVEFFKPLIES